MIDGRGDTYTPEEIEALRAQLRRANAEARAEIERRGGPRLHPRVQALKDRGLWPPGAGVPVPPDR